MREIPPQRKRHNINSMSEISKPNNQPTNPPNEMVLIVSSLVLSCHNDESNDPLDLIYSWTIKTIVVCHQQFSHINRGFYGRM